MAVVVACPPVGLEEAYQEIYTQDCLLFVAKLIKTFRQPIQQLYTRRRSVRDEIARLADDDLLTFLTPPPTEGTDWTIAPLPERLFSRKLDLGDVSPADLGQLKKALNTKASAVQVDFDDGHCPTWRNQLLGHYNLMSLVKGTHDLENSPIMMMRPRAWNITDHQHTLDGWKLPGAAVDFALIAFHLCQPLSRRAIGPYLYLSKIENSEESRLWNEIFTWTENELDLTKPSFRACILIENVIAATQMEQILYNIREHSLGLNCGIWDYCASFISVFGTREKFIIPDRSRYVDMSKHFLKSYLQLTVDTCHKHQAPATSGMAAALASASEAENELILQKIKRGKQRELDFGADGFLVYDTSFISDLMIFIDNTVPGLNQLDKPAFQSPISIQDLLLVPQGGVTLEGLKMNIKVTLLFIYNWFQGNGVFEMNSAVEDSATADISRLQIWQWCHHAVQLEGSNQTITRELVSELLDQLGDDLTNINIELLRGCAKIFMEMLNAVPVVEFITTYLNEHDGWKEQNA